jgi:long-chain acyl-CoA synthetase
METASGPEPCAVLAMHGRGDQAAAAIERANQSLDDFQRVSRWVLWPEPDLPRTSSGKVRRKAVSAWLAGIQDPEKNGEAAATHAEGFGASSDWLLKLIAEISGETPSGIGDELRLTEDLHLDSLARVQLAAALEERMGIAPEGGPLEEARTLGELRSLVAGEDASDQASEGGEAFNPRNMPTKPEQASAPEEVFSPTLPEVSNSFATDPVEPVQSIYPLWPWLAPVRWLRVAFIEAVVRPLVWLLAAPRVVAPELPAAPEPMLIIANHVTAFDGPLIQCALPAAQRHRIAVAMAGDMLEEYRHFRNPERAPGKRGFYLPGPLVWLLLTALFNVFPLPRRRNFQRSFAHAGQALDRGYNVLLFPEGTRSAEGSLARFRGGIGLLVKQSGVPVLSVGLRGLGELKTAGRGWFRSGKIEVRVGEPIRFAPRDSEAEITARLHAEVSRLMKDREQGSGNRDQS